MAILILRCVIVGQRRAWMLNLPAEAEIIDMFKS